MHRVDGPGHANNLFTEGDPQQAVPATIVTDDWLNDVQEELANIIEDAGITLSKGTQTQLRDAVNVMINPVLPLTNVAALRALSEPGAIQIRQTLGYTDAGDGGDGVYWWNASDTRTDNGGTVIQPDSLPASGRWNLFRPTGGTNVLQWGCKGDGVTDDEPRFNVALLNLDEYGELYVPDKEYFVNDTLFIQDKERWRLWGPGLIQPGAGVDGLPVLLVQDCREAVIEGLTIRGQSSNPPSAGIRFHQTAGGAYAQGGHELRNLVIGSISSNSLVDGVDFTASSDQNNEHVHAINITIQNISGVAWHVEHSNSLLHVILGGTFGGGTHGFRFAGGSANIYGANVGCASGGWLFEYASGTTQYHSLELHGVHSEGPFKIMKLAADGVTVTVNGGHFKGGVDGGVDNVEVTGSNVRIHSSDTIWGGGGTDVVFNGGTSSQNFFSFKGGELGFTTYTWNGHLSFINAYRSPGAITLTPQASATFCENASTGGTAGDGRKGFRLGESGDLGSAVIGTYQAVRASVAASDYSANPIAANTAAFFDVAVPGLKTDGKCCVSATPQGDPGNGLIWAAFPLSNGNARVWVGNVTGGNITPGTVDWRVEARQYS